MTITIKSWTRRTIHTSEKEATKEALIEAIAADADLTDADLRGADLRGAVLRGAVLRGAVLTDESVAGNQSSVPLILNIHRAVLAAATAEGCTLDMRCWHTCETTHCRAGWVVHLAGDAGLELERRIGTPDAAMRIYLASDPGYRDKTVRLPKWYCTNEEALADMRACAEREASAEAKSENGGN